LFVRSDPKPNNFIAAVKNADCSIAPPDTCRYKLRFTVDVLKIQSRMTRVLTKELVRCSRLLSHFNRQCREQLSKSGVGV